MTTIEKMCEDAKRRIMQSTHIKAGLHSRAIRLAAEKARADLQEQWLKAAIKAEQK